MNRTSKMVAVAMLAAVLIAPAVAVAAITWQITMRGSAAYPKANGTAQYQSQAGHREVQVEVQHVRSLAGQTVVFTAGGTKLGSQKVSALGRADITRNTELGQKVPSITHGSPVSVKTASGRLVASGRF
jgi:opacity protein-like surface antigen